jgi:hypothetical protein
VCVRTLSPDAPLREKIFLPCSDVVMLRYSVPNGNICPRRPLKPQYKREVCSLIEREKLLGGQRSVLNGVLKKLEVSGVRQMRRCVANAGHFFWRTAELGSEYVYRRLLARTKHPINPFLAAVYRYCPSQPYLCSIISASSAWWTKEEMLGTRACRRYSRCL